MIGTKEMSFFKLYILIIFNIRNYIQIHIITIIG